MIKSPFLYKEWLTSAEYEKLAQLSIQWSSIEHVIGNCLRVMLGLSDEEALIVVFPPDP